MPSNKSAQDKGTFVLTLPLIVEDQVSWRLAKALDVSLKIYNATLDTARKALQLMRESVEWQEALKIKDQKKRNERLGQLHKDYGLTQYDCHTIALHHLHGMKRDDIGPHEAQWVSDLVWHALEAHIFRKAGKPRFKSAKRGFNVISGLGATDIVFNIADLNPLGSHYTPSRILLKMFPHAMEKDGVQFMVTEDTYKKTKVKKTCHLAPVHPKPQPPMVYWRGLFIPVMMENTGLTPYQLAAVCKDPKLPFTPDNFKRVKYCQLVRRTINGKKRWYVHVYLEGKPPVMHPRAPVTDVMGIDPSTKSIAYFSEKEAGIVALAPNVDMQGAKLRRLQQQMERSRRINNPDNYNADGTVKKGPHEWKKGNRYCKKQAQYAELCRKAAATRQRDHGTLINKLLAQAGTIKYEVNSFRSFQRNFGPSVALAAPGLFFIHLKRSAASANLKVEELNAYDLKMSQYDFFSDSYTKKPLSQRWHPVGDTGIWVQRDAMSALLACYATKKGHDRALLLSKWPAAEALLSVSGLCRQQPCKIKASLPPRILKRIRKRRRKAAQPSKKRRLTSPSQAKSKTTGTGKRSDANS